MRRGFTFLKMDLGLGQLLDVPGTVNGPAGLLAEMQACWDAYGKVANLPPDEERRAVRSRWHRLTNVLNTVTGLHLTEKGVDTLARFVADVRRPSVPTSRSPPTTSAPSRSEDAIRVLRRLEPYDLAWFEDPLPWHLTEQYRRLSAATAVPLCTGEDIWLAESFRPLLEAGAIAVAHPDVLTVGGIMETKRLSDLALERGVPMAVHMAESPVGCLAAVHAAAASENFLALEFHSADVAWWDDLVVGPAKPIVKDGFIAVPETPGLGIESLDEEVIAAHLAPDTPSAWEPTDRWDGEWSHDRTWS